MNIADSFVSNYAWIFAVLPIIAWLLSFRRRVDQDDRDHEALTNIHREMKKIKLVRETSYAIFFIPSILVVWGGLSLFSSVFNAFTELEGVYVFRTNIVFLAVPSIFLGVFLAMLPARILSIYRLGDGIYRDYERLESKSRFNAKRFGWLLFIIYGIPTLFLALSSFNTYVRITPDEFIFNDVLGFGEKSYRFDQISEVNIWDSCVRQNGKRTNARSVIVFDDGYEYRFINSTAKIDFLYQKHIIEYMTRDNSSTIDFNIRNGC
uniref:hypothetical protein n=1 Tax=Thaumasiovibrio occultus TaxID=1891184 RepID=UPI000B34E7F7|nr:hypothetical protein [Thaumasiovibrio occultus]